MFLSLDRAVVSTLEMHVALIAAVSLSCCDSECIYSVDFVKRFCIFETSLKHLVDDLVCTVTTGCVHTNRKKSASLHTFLMLFDELEMATRYFV